MKSISLRILKQGRADVLRFDTHLVLIWLNKDSAITFKDGLYFDTDSIYLSDYCEDPHNPTQTEISLIELTLGITIDLKG